MKSIISFKISTIIYILLFICIFSDLLLSGIRVFGANIRMYAFIIILILILFSWVKNIRTYPQGLGEYLSILTPIFIIIFIGFFIEIIYNADFLNAIRWFITQSTLCMISLTFPFYVNSKKRMKFILYFIILIVTISAIFAILQFLIGGVFFDIRDVLNKDPHLRASGYIRFPGLSVGFIPFSYELVSVTIIITTFLFYGGYFRFYKNLTNLIFSIILIFAMILNFTRSALLGLVVGLVFVGFIKRKLHILFIFLFLIGIPFWLLIINNPIYSRVLVLSDHSAQSRLPRYAIALNTILEKPLGIGMAEIHERGTYIFDKLFNYRPVLYAGNTYSPHNHFLTVGVAFGVISMLLYMIFLLVAFKIIISIFYNTSDNFLYVLSIGFIGFFFAYIINSLFHNYGPIISEKMFWYIFGLILSVYKLVMKDKNLCDHNF